MGDSFTDFGPTYLLPEASDEQLLVIGEIAGSNLIVDSVAGSGKTTTILHMARRYPEKKILVITYNAKLKMETRYRVSALNLQNMIVHTYHSFGYAYIGPQCKTDQGIIEFINNETCINIPLADIIIIDECQDMTPLYCKFMAYIIGRLPGARLCMIGDERQSIYDYAGADSRFLTLADKIWGGAQWKRLQLTTSYRLTRQMAAFINSIANTKIVTMKTGTLPMYNIDNYRMDKALEDTLMLLSNGHAPGDIFIIAPSIRSSNAANPIKQFANRLSREGVPIYIPLSDESGLDEEVLRGKIVFSSFHQTKGLERRAVLVLGFDSSYFKYYNKHAPTDTCTNALYVALTRATEYLSLYHLYGNQPLEFVNPETLGIFTKLHGKQGGGSPTTGSTQSLSVVNLVSHLDTVTLSMCDKFFGKNVVKPAAKIIRVPIKAKQTTPSGDKFCEDVSDINGVAISAYYEYMKTGSMSIGKHSKLYQSHYPNRGEVPIHHLLQISNEYIAYRNGLQFKLNQIYSYDWISAGVFKNAYKRLSGELGSRCGDAQFEVPVECVIEGIKLLGAIDVVFCSDLVEIKAVTTLRPEHFLQLAVYMYMYSVLHPGEAPTCHLYNVITGELVELTYNTGDLCELVKFLIHKKLNRIERSGDDEFLTLNTNGHTMDYKFELNPRGMIYGDYDQYG